MTHLNSHDAAELMQAQTGINIPTQTPMYNTENNYWIADLENGTAVVLAPDAQTGGKSFVVEGMHSLEQLLLMVEGRQLDNVAECGCGNGECGCGKEECECENEESGCGCGCGCHH